MGIWVRSQNKQKLLKCCGINVYDNCSVNQCQYDIYCNGSNYDTKQFLGTYSTKEKALKVVDMLEKRIVIRELYKSINIDATKLNITDETRFNDTLKEIFMFQMPEDKEV